MCKNVSRFMRCDKTDSAAETEARWNESIRNCWRRISLRYFRNNACWSQQSRATLGYRTFIYILDHLQGDKCVYVFLYFLYSNKHSKLYCKEIFSKYITLSLHNIPSYVPKSFESDLRMFWFQNLFLNNNIYIFQEKPNFLPIPALASELGSSILTMSLHH